MGNADLIDYGAFEDDRFLEESFKLVRGAVSKVGPVAFACIYSRGPEGEQNLWMLRPQNDGFVDSVRTFIKQGLPFIRVVVLSWPDPTRPHVQYVKVERAGSMERAFEGTVVRASGEFVITRIVEIFDYRFCKIDALMRPLSLRPLHVS